VNGPFTADFFALHTDAMKDVYPSRHAEDLTWQKIDLVTGGEATPPRTKASLVAWGNALLLFGGLADHNGKPNMVKRCRRSVAQPLAGPPRPSGSSWRGC